MYTVKLRLGKKDAVLKQLIEYERANEDNVSCAISETLLYYIRYGTYLRIANIPKQKIHVLPDGYRSLSFRENTEVHQWLISKEAEGQKVSTVVKRILKASITTLDDPLMILLSDDLCMINDRKRSNLVFETGILNPEVIKEPDYSLQVDVPPVMESMPEPEKVLTSIPIQEDAGHREEETEVQSNERAQMPAVEADHPKKRKKKGGLLDNLITEGLNL